MEDEYVPDRWAGISLGLEYKFRLLKTKEQGDYVIFDFTTGKIIERLPRKETEFDTERCAMKRLYEINSLEQCLSKEIMEAIDQTS